MDAQLQAAGECIRCGTGLAQNGRCQDLTCPFEAHDQDCPAGFNGHPEYPIRECRCRPAPERSDRDA